MKKSVYFIAIILLVLFSVACKKNETPKPSISGYWTGTVIPDASPAQFIGMLYRADGTIRGYASNPDTSVAMAIEGTYSIDSDSIRTTLISSTEIIKLSAKLTGNQMVGNMWKETSIFNATYSITKP